MASTSNGALASPRVIVALDFGTTYSGFAFAHVTNPARIYVFYDYPGSGREKPYVKTLTASYYKRRPGTEQEWELKSWGYSARTDFERDVQACRKHRTNIAKGLPSDGVAAPTQGQYLTKFKLHLASSDMEAMSTALPLPIGLTKEVVIADYLRGRGGVIVTHLQHRFGAHFTMEMLQCCITVPAIWDDSAKATMKSCMEAAGLVKGVSGSPHPLIVVLEPEAASFYCHKAMSEPTLDVGHKLLVADIGGGTSDIVVQEVVSIKQSKSSDPFLRVKEATTSTGGLVGGTSVDNCFMEFLCKTIGPCLPECIVNHRNVATQLLTAWECAKQSFGEPTTRGVSVDIDFPNTLATAWAGYDRQRGNPERDSYDGLEISYQDVTTIFDPVVDRILSLISDQLFDAKGNIKVPVKALVVVGGFVESPYLLDRILRRFANVVPHIFSPPNPGSAVALALNPNMVVSRICKRTYGFRVRRNFEEGVDPEEYKVIQKRNGNAECKSRFCVLVRKGDEVKVDECVSRMCNAFHDSKRNQVCIYSSDKRNPRYAKGQNVKKEVKLYVFSDTPPSSAPQVVKVSIYFGRSCIEVKVEGVTCVVNQEVDWQIPVDNLF
ncbi:hypothetical protein M758_4G207200 [Ceratodon purpureus]|nr:hypothetical protein M758_4G207200 [Ceratodon purpureus]